LLINRSAGGQLEQPCDVNNSTTTGLSGAGIAPSAARAIVIGFNPATLSPSAITADAAAIAKSQRFTILEFPPPLPKVTPRPRDHKRGYTQQQIA
jgi:hypothetical protein